MIWYALCLIPAVALYRHRVNNGYYLRKIEERNLRHAAPDIIIISPTGHRDLSDVPENLEP